MISAIAIISLTALLAYLIIKISRWYRNVMNSNLRHTKTCLELISKIANENELSETQFDRLKFLVESIDHVGAQTVLLKAITEDYIDSREDEDPFEGLSNEAVEDMKEAVWHWMMAVSMQKPFKYPLLEAIMRDALSPKKEVKITGAVIHRSFQQEYAA